MKTTALVICVAAGLLLVQPAAGAEKKEKQSASEREFCRLDKNNDREITFEEFSACEFYKIEHVRKLPYSDPELKALYGGRPLSDDELKAYLFNKADKNKDRKIDRKEWEEFYASIMNPGMNPR